MFKTSLNLKDKFGYKYDLTRFKENKVKTLDINKVKNEEEENLDTAHFPCRMDEMYDETFHEKDAQS